MSICEYRDYRDNNIISMRPHVIGQDMTYIVVDPELIDEVDTVEGAMIAFNGWQHRYVSKEDFDNNYEEIDD